MNDAPVLDPEIEALEAEVAAARKIARKVGRRLSITTQKKRDAAEEALSRLVSIGRWEGKGIGPTCRELRSEMAAVHPEWNRRGRRAFVAGFRRKGHK